MSQTSTSTDKEGPLSQMTPIRPWQPTPAHSSSEAEPSSGPWPGIFAQTSPSSHLTANGAALLSGPETQAAPALFETATTSCQLRLGSAVALAPSRPCQRRQHLPQPHGMHRGAAAGPQSLTGPTLLQDGAGAVLAQLQPVGAAGRASPAQHAPEHRQASNASSAESRARHAAA